MTLEPFPESWYAPVSEHPSLPVYFLGPIPLSAFLSWQRRLAFEVALKDRPGCLVVCEHPPAISIGREGSRVHLRFRRTDPQQSGWPIIWVPRGGGALLHMPGQIAIYPLFNWESLAISPVEFRDRLTTAIATVLREYTAVESRTGRAGLFVRDRLITHIGVAIRQGCTRFGATINAHLDLQPTRAVWVDGDPTPITSLHQETILRVRIATLRQRLAEAVADVFGFDRLTVHHHHPALETHAHHASPR
jgi:lipoyl(octanoyl) transferase